MFRSAVFTVFLIIAFSSAVAAQQQGAIVYLKDGTVLMGELVKKSDLSIQLRDTKGNLHVLFTDDIKMITDVTNHKKGVEKTNGFLLQSPSQNQNSVSKDDVERIMTKSLAERDSSIFERVESMIANKISSDASIIKRVVGDDSYRHRLFVNTAISYCRPLSGDVLVNEQFTRNKFADFSSFSIGLQSEVVYMLHPNFGIIPMYVGYNKLSTNSKHYPYENPSAWTLASMVGIIASSNNLSIFRPFGQIGTGLRHLSVSSRGGALKDKSTDLLFSIGGGTYLEINKTFSLSLKLLYQTTMHDQTADKNANYKISQYGEIAFNLGCAVILF